MRNGTDPFLAKPLLENKKPVTLDNTSAFDSIVALIIIAVTDFTNVQDKVNYNYSPVQMKCTQECYYNINLKLKI